MQAGRAAQAAVSACARALSSTAASAAVPATVTQSSGPLGFFNKKAAMPPMNVPLDGVDPVSPAPVPASTPPTETSSLSNGVRVGAQEVMVRPPPGRGTRPAPMRWQGQVRGQSHTLPACRTR